MATEKDLFARADHLQRLAYDLIDQLHFMQLWQSSGMNPILIGSVRTGLMAEPNLDFNIITSAEEPDLNVCFSAFQTLVQATGRFGETYFYVNIHRPPPNAYLYFNFGFVFAGEEWDFDNEVLPASHPRARTASQTTEALLRVMDAERRARILRIKQERLENRGGSWRGKSEPTSLDVYRAVFDGGASTLAEVEDWVADHPGPADYFWLPPAAGKGL